MLFDQVRCRRMRFPVELLGTGFIWKFFLRVKTESTLFWSVVLITSFEKLKMPPLPLGIAGKSRVTNGAWREVLGPNFKLVSKYLAAVAKTLVTVALGS